MLLAVLLWPRPCRAAAQDDAALASRLAQAFAHGLPLPAIPAGARYDGLRALAAKAAGLRNPVEEGRRQERLRTIDLFGKLELGVKVDAEVAVCYAKGCGATQPGLPSARPSLQEARTRAVLAARRDALALGPSPGLVAASAGPSGAKVPGDARRAAASVFQFDARYSPERALPPPLPGEPPPPSPAYESHLAALRRRLPPYLRALEPGSLPAAYRQWKVEQDVRRFQRDKGRLPDAGERAAIVAAAEKAAYGADALVRLRALQAERAVTAAADSDLEAVTDLTPLAIKDDLPDALAAARDGRLGPFALAAGMTLADFSGPFKGVFRGVFKKVFARDGERAAGRVLAREGAEAGAKWDLKQEMLRGDERLKEMKYANDTLQPRDTSRMYLSAEAGKTFARSVKAMSDKKRFANWARGYKREVLERMRRDGVPNDDAVFARYFSALAHEKLEKAGFKFPPDGKVTIAGEEFAVKDGYVELDRPLSDEAFQAVVAKGYLFIETHEIFFVGGLTNYHGAMSHLVQALYLADANGPGFATFYRRMGPALPGARNPLWETLGDGPRGTLGSPSTINVTVCEFFRFPRCPAKID